MADQQIEVPLGSTARTPIETLAYENGPRVAPTGPPTVGATHVNAVATSLTAVITQLQNTTPANITGAYSLSFATGAPNNLAVGDVVWVEVLATISGTQTSKVCQFLIVPAAPTTTPMIR